ncbi:MAG: hypothetical protein FWH05_05850 [Oscillospiraceae bacterium]|nr:hypothetical protein [Oscillospiraceae bacterium]
MSNKELCIGIINSFREDQLKNIVTLLQTVKNLVVRTEDEGYGYQVSHAHDAIEESSDGTMLSIKDFYKEL